MKMIYLASFFALFVGNVTASDFNSGKLSEFEREYSSNIDTCTELSLKPLTSIKDKLPIEPTHCKNVILYLYLNAMHSCTSQTKQAFASELELLSKSDIDSIQQKRITNHLSMIEDEEKMRLKAKKAFLELPENTQAQLISTEIGQRPFNGVEAAGIYCKE